MEPWDFRNRPDIRALIERDERVQIEAARILAGDESDESDPDLVAEAWDLVRTILQ